MYVNFVDTAECKVHACARATGQGNHFELIPTVSMESQYSTGGTNLSWLSKICNRFGEIDSGSRKSLTSIKPKLRFFGKKYPLRANFHKCFPGRNRPRGNTTFCENFVKFGRPEVGEIVHRLMDKKNKISARPPAAASARIAPKICQGQLQTIDSAFPKFHPNPFTSGVVIAERVNTVLTRDKMFPILGRSLASSRIKMTYLVGRVDFEPDCFAANKNN